MLTNAAISRSWGQMLEEPEKPKHTAAFVVCEVDHEIRIIYWNRPFFGADSMTSSSAANLEAILFRDGRDSGLLETARIALRQGTEVRLPMPGLHTDATSLVPELILTPLFDDFGRITHCVGTLREGPANAGSAPSDCDQTTKLPNRLRFYHHLAGAISRASDTQGQIAVLAIDLDQIKLVNDMLGMAAGNRLLHALAERLRGTVRLGDIVACFGGDDFAMLIDGLKSGSDSAIISDKLLAEIARPFHLDGERVVCTASIGISCYPQDGGEPDLLMHHATTALAQAKAAGGNTHRFFAPRMNDKEVARFVIGNQLRQALDRDELTLHFQPRSDIRTGAITGLEALIRWHHPSEGLLAPARFIPLAEQTRLIETIDDWVLRTACRQMSVWKDAGMAPPRMAVNLSARQFRRPELPQHIEAILSEFKLAPHELEIEITESLAMQDPILATTLLNQLSEIGVMLAIDDFGTGHSSLAYLKRFPIDYLKIDRSFVCDLPDDPHDVAITCAIIALAQNLGLGLIAEGVETEAQKAFLAAKGCNEVQGFLFSRPVPVPDIERLLLGTRVRDQYSAS
jgi:diguanylate cyclase (GGDEF)-like protein